MTRILLVFTPLGLALLVGTFTQQAALGPLGVVLSLGAAWAALRSQGRGWADVGLPRRPRWRPTLAWAAGGSVGLVLLGSGTGTLLRDLGGLKPDLEAFEALKGNAGLLAGVLLIAWTTAAFGEEMLFRGFLLNALRSHLGGWTGAVVASSALFGAAHFYQGPGGMILTGIVGAGAAGLYLISRRNLWAAILAHGLFDTVGIVTVYLSGTQTGPGPPG